MSDVAVVRVDGENLPAVKLGDSDKIVVGQIAIAIGNPYGFLLPGPTATVGVISGLKRHIHIENHMYEDLQELTAQAKAHGLVVIVWSYPRGAISKDVLPWP